MICESPCYEFVLKCCLGSIHLNGGLVANTQYMWSIHDQLQGQTYEGISITDGNGIITIDTSLLPPALFNEAAGFFELKIKTAGSNHTPVPLTFGAKQYDCVLLSFGEYEGTADPHDTIK